MFLPKCKCERVNVFRNIKICIFANILLGTTHRWPADRAPIEIMEVTWANTLMHVPNIRSHHLCKYRNHGIIYGRHSLAWNCDQDAITMLHSTCDSCTMPKRHFFARFINRDVRKRKSERVSRNVNLQDLCKVRELFVSDD